MEPGVVRGHQTIVVPTIAAVRLSKDVNQGHAHYETFKSNIYCFVIVISFSFHK